MTNMHEAFKVCATCQLYDAHELLRVAGAPRGWHACKASIMNDGMPAYQQSTMLAMPFNGATFAVAFTAPTHSCSMWTPPATLEQLAELPAAPPEVTEPMQSTITYGETPPAPAERPAGYFNTDTDRNNGALEDRAEPKDYYGKLPANCPYGFDDK